jgi:hypothetical protein
MLDERHKQRKMWLCILIVFLVGILFLGLRPKDFRFENGVAWLEEGTGIRFNDYGLAFTEPLFRQAGADAPLDQGFSIGISLRSTDEKRGNFGFIVSVQDGKDRDQFLVGQWRSHIIVMNGDAYNHKRRFPRISVDTALQKNRPLFMTLTTGKQGTRVYIDGHIAKTDSKLTLALPSGKARSMAWPCTAAS